MERIYEPEYIKILRRSQFREKDQVVKFAKNDGFNGQRITDSAFKKIDNVFIVSLRAKSSFFLVLFHINFEMSCANELTGSQRLY